MCHISLYFIQYYTFPLLNSAVILKLWNPEYLPKYWPNKLVSPKKQIHLKNWICQLYQLFFHNFFLFSFFIKKYFLTKQKKFTKKFCPQKNLFNKNFFLQTKLFSPTNFFHKKKLFLLNFSFFIQHPISPKKNCWPKTFFWPEKHFFYLKYFFTNISLFKLIFPQQMFFFSLKLKLWQNSKAQILTKLKKTLRKLINLNITKIQKLKLWQNPKTPMVKNSKTQIVMKLKLRLCERKKLNSNFDNSISDKT